LEATLTDPPLNPYWLEEKSENFCVFHDPSNETGAAKAGSAARDRMAAAIKRNIETSFIGCPFLTGWRDHPHQTFA
jgi:hypothetical protein